MPGIFQPRETLARRLRAILAPNIDKWLEEIFLIEYKMCCWCVWLSCLEDHNNSNLYPLTDKVLRCYHLVGKITAEVDPNIPRPQSTQQT